MTRSTDPNDPIEPTPCPNRLHTPTRNEHNDVWCKTCGERLLVPGSAGYPQAAFDNPCLYCGTDDDDVPYEDTEQHRNTSQHQYAQLTS